ncbi:MAG: GDP-perosamine synthase [Gammaproteobacteria bacterium]|nr:GDP-perosamine synthase [Gammaproteobacteria bacterium]
MSGQFIPVCAPMLIGNEKEYVMDCLETTWISSSGKYIERFEAAFAEFCGVKHALTCCNGTVALHLALMALGVGPGDEVIVPTLTYVATANAVTYCGARPVLVDSEPKTWNLDPALIEASVTPRTKGIIVVHLYGHPAEMDAIRKIADHHGLFIIEDAAEAHGAEYKGCPVGTIGDVGTFSFYGNKIITTGEGGMLVTNNDALAARIRQLKGQGMDPQRRYWFPIVGYNYRMTNIAAALGLAQLEKIEWHMRRRIEVAAWYQEELQNLDEVIWQSEEEWAKHAYWIFTILLREGIGLSRDDLMLALQEQGIETRPIFYPMHQLPMYHSLRSAGGYPVADRLARQGINLPTWAGLTRTDVSYICQSLRESLRGCLMNIA